MVNIFRRQTASVILNGYFHKIILLPGIDSHLTPLGSVLTCIFCQCIYHKESQCPVCLHTSIGRLYFQIQLFHFKSPAPFPQQFKKLIQFKNFDAQTQRTLLHLNPQSQNIIILVNGGNKLINILILFFFDSFIMDISHAYQFMHLVQNAVDVRMNTINNRKASLLNQILSFVSGNMPFMNIALFLQSALFLAKENGSHSVV